MNIPVYQLKVETMPKIITSLNQPVEPLCRFSYSYDPIKTSKQMKFILNRVIITFHYQSNQRNDATVIQNPHFVK